MNLVQRYLTITTLKQLEDYLLLMNRRNYNSIFAKIRAELMKSGMCSAMKIQLKDKNTAMISVTISGQSYLLLWDFSLQKLIHKGVKKYA